VSLDPLLFGVRRRTNPEGSAFTIELRSAAGAVLASSRFDPDFRLELFDEESTPAIVETEAALFRVNMEFPAATAEVIVLRGKEIVARLVKSATSPEVTISTAGLRGQTLEVAWSASDADGNALKATVSLIEDGVTTTVLAIDLTEESFTAALEGDRDPARLEVEVEVTDGFLTASARRALGERAAGNQVPGDCTGDGVLDISDGICIFGFLFLGAPARLPCGDGAREHPANLALLDWGADDVINLTDGIQMLQFLFLSGPPHPLAAGGRCRVVADCGDGPTCR
jgi:hypothetical protein